MSNDYLRLEDASNNLPECFMCWTNHDDTKPCPPPRKLEEPEITVVFAAKYNGYCFDCSNPINVGDKVMYTNNELTHYVCP